VTELKARHEGEKSQLTADLEVVRGELRELRSQSERDSGQSEQLTLELRAAAPGEVEAPVVPAAAAALAVPLLDAPMHAMSRPAEGGSTPRAPSSWVRLIAGTVIVRAFIQG